MIEVAFQIERPKLRARIQEDLEAYLEDNVNAWQLNADGSYTRLAPGDALPVSAQQRLLERYAD